LSRARIAVVVAVVIVFAVGGGILINANRTHGGVNRTIDVTVTAATSMKPSELTANQNDTVTINVTSDTDGEVHLHGYDIHFDCKAGQVTSHTFKAVNTGHFDIEWETTSAPLGELVVT
jgi:hypothetical protein